MRRAYTKKDGMNLAGILLLGSEQLIISVLPYHKTDAIKRVRNLDRYDDSSVRLMLKISPPS